LHGLSVAAIALRVDDPGRAAERATAMLAKPFVGPIGKGELEIPAVRGVSGSLIYFIDRAERRGAFFEVDFVPDPEPEAPPGLGLTRIDHVAQVVPESELLSWVLYYRSIFGLEPAERADLADPHGLIVSRAMANSERTLRIALNASHFDLDDATIARLRDLAIFYDRSGAGEFFQLFTRSINGVFFEIVERRNYDRYGEANAPARLAAQAALDRSAAEILTEFRG
jgi:4-hydroxyphenylpyruvate dioxygenase